MGALIEVVAAVVGVGMVLGGLPRLRIDRTGVALLGAIALVASGAMGLDAAVRAVDLPTILLLWAFLVVAAQLRVGGFYAAATRWIAARPLPPRALLGLVVASSGMLSALFSNDVVCLATAPVLAGACRERGLDPRPFLIALACAANVGSAATLVGNPQNMLIGQRLHLSFSGYLAEALVPVLLGLAAVWAAAARTLGPGAAPAPAHPAESGELDRRQTVKGLIVVAAVGAGFVAGSMPRELVALAGAGVLLVSRRVHSRDILELVDWGLLVLFAGLFIVDAALAATGLPARAIAGLAAHGVDLARPWPMLAAAVGLSNAVSNVPAVMLLLPEAARGGLGVLLALASTFAGNLLVIGSIANLIVFEVASRDGVALSWRDHARIAWPASVAGLAVLAGWIALR